MIDGKEADFCFFKLLELPDLNVRYSLLNLANDLLSRGMVAMQEMRDEERKGYSSELYYSGFSLFLNHGR